MNFRHPIQRALILAEIACVSGCAANLHKTEFGVIGGNAYMDVSVEFVENAGSKSSEDSALQRVHKVHRGYFLGGHSQASSSRDG